MVSLNKLFKYSYQALWEYKDESIFQDVYNQIMEVIKCVQQKSKSEVEDYKHEEKGSDKVMWQTTAKCRYQGLPS